MTTLSKEINEKLMFKKTQHENKIFIGYFISD